ncbi:hypothetical protein SDC9_82796 [bioreactor metagenome]|uniref:Uncharacterized protein n=1 Tax=bioreactor metagenome TaxID=1076179 RepID=A0A644Z882_9ZZZZ
MERTSPAVPDGAAGEVGTQWIRSDDLVLGRRRCRALGGGALRPRAQDLEDHRQQRHEDDDDGDQVDVVGDQRDATEEEARGRHDADPQEAAQGVPADEVAVRVTDHAGDQRDVRPDDRDEPGQHQGAAAVLVEELFGAVQVLGLQHPGVVLEQATAEAAAEEVAHLVTEEGADERDTDQHPDVDAQRHVQQRGGEQQRVTRQEGEQQTGFDEHHHGDTDQRPRAELVQERRRITEIVQSGNRLRNKCHQIHKSHGAASTCAGSEPERRTGTIPHRSS